MTEGLAGSIPQQHGAPPAGPYLGQLPMGDRGHQGDFGEQLVQSLAIAANLDVSTKPSRDRLGIDWEFTYPGRAGTRRHPKIVAQVKSWSTPAGNENEWRYPLRVHNFNNLAGQDWFEPRFLFLVVVPKDVHQWVEVTPDHLLMRHAVYWTCFHDLAPLGPDRRLDGTYTVPVPKQNLLTVPALHNLFDRRFRDMLVES
ncbi:DUF4365 domain-containing protein [Streptomyces sp. NPDC048277]|uniref:DUF4365 domain-containing protein n=1 Tax=Streptomyces sp. NPDC048277 TaxID=3155027 RepID=UPI00340AF5EB